MVIKGIPPINNFLNHHMENQEVYFCGSLDHFPFLSNTKNVFLVLKKNYIPTGFSDFQNCILRLNCKRKNSYVLFLVNLPNTSLTKNSQVIVSGPEMIPT